jgi:hypothetical protein
VATVVVTPGQPIQAGVAAETASMDDGVVPGISLGEDTPAPAVKAVKVPDAAALKAKVKKVAEVAPQPDAVVPDVTADAEAVAAEAAQQLAPAKVQPVKAAVVPKKVAKPVVAEPAAEPAAEDVAAEAPAAPAPVKQKLAAVTPAPAPAKTGGGGGYILQVFSGKSQAESLAYFADMQQKFGELIGTGQPDIQEVDLGSQGKKYRLRIGPPGSGGAVKNLCTKLKASGLKDCIVAVY